MHFLLLYIFKNVLSSDPLQLFSICMIWTKIHLKHLKLFTKCWSLLLLLWAIESVWNDVDLLDDFVKAAQRVKWPSCCADPAASQFQRRDVSTQLWGRKGGRSLSRSQLSPSRAAAGMSAGEHAAAHFAGKTGRRGREFVFLLFFGAFLLAPRRARRRARRRRRVAPNNSRGPSTCRRADATQLSKLEPRNPHGDSWWRRWSRRRSSSVSLLLFGNLKRARRGAPALPAWLSARPSACVRVRMRSDQLKVTDCWWS